MSLCEVTNMRCEHFEAAISTKTAVGETLTDITLVTVISIIIIIYFLWLCSPARAMASSFTRFLDHTQRRATVRRTPLDE
jgi:hypothetical protein